MPFTDTCKINYLYFFIFIYPIFKNNLKLINNIENQLLSILQLFLWLHLQVSELQLDIVA